MALESGVFAVYAHTLLAVVGVTFDAVHRRINRLITSRARVTPICSATVVFFVLLHGLLNFIHLEIIRQPGDATGWNLCLLSADGTTYLANRTTTSLLAGVVVAL